MAHQVLSNWDLLKQISQWNTDNVEIFLKKNRQPRLKKLYISSRAVTKVIEHGNLEYIKHIFNRRYVIHAIDRAAKSGHIHVVEWLHKNLWRATRYRNHICYERSGFQWPSPCYRMATS